MELRLVVPAQPEDDHAELLNGTFWRVSEPIDISKSCIPKYHCISYVWGRGLMEDGSLFQIGPRPMSDQTKPALEAAIVANEGAIKESADAPVRAFWIDAVCVPAEDGPRRHGTLESMGFIYSAAVSVIVILQQASWEVIQTACAKNSPDPLSESQMKVLNQDLWIESVWTYQELVNNDNIIFTSMHNEDNDTFVSISQLLNCVGFSLDRWKKENRREVDSIDAFVNLSAMEDTMVDWQISGYTERTALTVLSNLEPRRYDPGHPKNRLLAALGAITKDVSWGTPAETLSELVEKVMQTCEKKNDYSFIYTADERDDRAGLRWRPRPESDTSGVEGLQAQENIGAVSSSRMSTAQGTKGSSLPDHLRPILAWHCWADPHDSTQRARSSDAGFWLDNMIQLQPSSGISSAARRKLETWLWAFNEWSEDGSIVLATALCSAFAQMGFSGSNEPHLCESGLFFPQRSLIGKEDVELFAAGSIGWGFGAPGLARWKEGEVVMYSAGVFAGVIDKERAETLLIS